MAEVVVPLAAGLSYVNRVRSRTVTHIMKVDISWFQATKVGEATDVHIDPLTYKVRFKTDYELEDGWYYEASIGRILWDLSDNPYRLDLAIYKKEDDDRTDG